MRRDQIFGAEVGRVQFDVRTAHILGADAVFVLGGGQFIGNDDGHAFRLGQNIQQVGDLRHHVLVLVDDLVLLETGQTLQSHLQNLLCLVVRQLVQTVTLDAVMLGQILGAEGVDTGGIFRAGTGQHLAHHR